MGFPFAFALQITLLKSLLYADTSTLYDKTSTLYADTLQLYTDTFPLCADNLTLYAVTSTLHEQKHVILDNHIRDINIFYDLCKENIWDWQYML